MIDLLPYRLEGLLARLRSAYDGIGHSSGRPYLYFVYPPEQERAMRRQVDDTLRSDDSLCFHQVDLLPLTIAELTGQEDRRRELLLDHHFPGAAGDIVGLWTRALIEAIDAALVSPVTAGRPVVVLSGLAALHPLGNPTALMEGIAEQEPRDPRTNRIVPIVLLVPGTRPAQTSRQYRFLGLERRTLDFYRGEEL
jgi:hypothetical protein